MESQVKAGIFYFSANGGTKKAAFSLGEGLAEKGTEVFYVDVAKHIRENSKDAAYAAAQSVNLLVFASPTYSHHAPAVFMEFLNGLPEAEKDAHAAILSTYGGVSSGILIYEIAEIIYKKGYRLAGAIKVLSEHSLMFQGKKPLHPGKPDAEDLEAVKEFGKRLGEKRSATAHLSPEKDDQILPSNYMDKPGVLRFLDERFIHMDSLVLCMPRPKLNQKLCTSCGTCVKMCPVGNIELNGEYPVRKDNCIWCYNCVRFCPKEAMKASLLPVEPAIRLLSRIFGKAEELKTQMIVSSR